MKGIVSTPDSLTSTKTRRVYPFVFIANDVELQKKADILFKQSLEQVNHRVLHENNLECIKNNEFTKEELSHWIDGIPYQMKAGVELDHGQFKDMVNSMLDDINHGQEKEVYFYHSDLCKSREQSQAGLSYAETQQSVRSKHLGSASWITDFGGEAVQHIQHLPYGEPYVNQHPFGYSERFTFTGKERDEETGYGYFGARYMDHELMTMWLSVDPMADKYPSFSPYAYCIWNPVKLVDPDGNEAGIPPTWVRTGWFALRHPQIASAIGSCRPGEMNTNISTRSERFATRGSSYSSQGTIFRSNGCTEDPDPCSEIGAFRHTLWQATIASYYGRDIATQVGNAHEDNPNANLKARRFSSMAEADQVVDLLNNMLGRTIGEQNPNCPMNELAGKVLESFYKTGLYTGSLNEDGSWSVSRTKITKEQYDSYLNVLGGLDFNGFNSIEQANYRAKCERENQAIQEAGRWIDNK